MEHAFLASRTGAVFMSKVEAEPDGALTILSSNGHGYRSAHRDHAASHFGTRRLSCMNRLTWRNLDGVWVVLTHWKKPETSE